MSSTAQADDFEVDEWRLRVAFLEQEGRGAQSQADPQIIDGMQRGSEALSVLQTNARVGIRQNPRVRHTVDLPVDIVTSASADALDAVSTASLWTEAATVRFRHQIDITDDDHLEVMWGAHLEEVMKSGFGGFAYRRDLAHDNASVEVRTSLSLDLFDPITPQGFDYGFTRRGSFLASVSGTQILSPTTWVEGSYGLTVQWGVLATTWNAVPLQTAILPADELFPGRRVRHALSGGIAQHIPFSRTTFRAQYRFYADDFDARAHTAELNAYQWLGRHATLRVLYRFHDQTGVNFFYDQPGPDNLFESGLPRTADSDLGSFIAHEWGLGTTLYLSRAGEPKGERTLTVFFRRYTRPYMDLSVMSVGYGQVF